MPLIENVGDYLRPLGELGLPAKVLGLLPYEPTGDGQASVMLPPEQWRDILDKGTAQTQDGTYRLKLIGDAVRATLVKVGLDPAKALTAQQVQCLAALQDAPDFIRDAEWLSIEEKFKLFQAKGPADDGLVEEAKEMTIEEFRRRRVAQDENDPPRYEGKTVLSVFEECLESLKRERREDKEESLFESREGLLRAILDRLQNDEAVRYGETATGPALGLLRSQLGRSTCPCSHCWARRSWPGDRRSAPEDGGCMRSAACRRCRPKRNSESRSSTDNRLG